MTLRGQSGFLVRNSFPYIKRYMYMSVGEHGLRALFVYEQGDADTCTFVFNVPHKHREHCECCF